MEAADKKSAPLSLAAAAAAAAAAALNLALKSSCPLLDRMSVIMNPDDCLDDAVGEVEAVTEETAADLLFTSSDSMLLLLR